MNNPKNPVGYKRPPREHQFQKGQSGNPKGRPKGHRNFATEMSEELQERIRVTEGSHAHTLSKMRALIKRTMEQALKGNLRAVELLMKWAQVSRTDEEEALETEELPLADRTILQRAFEQMQAAQANAANEGDIT